jgi:hypothetical protein
MPVFLPSHGFHCVNCTTIMPHCVSQKVYSTPNFGQVLDHEIASNQDGNDIESLE